MEKVLCLTKVLWTSIDEDELWLDNDPISRSSRKIVKYLPLYDHPHNDIENGQKEIHYHQDTRYKGNGLLSDFKSFRSGRVILPLVDGEKLEYWFLIKVRDIELSSTPVNLIKKSNLKHKCIYKNKCPHRGFDLSGIQPINGVITCPLHSLKFNAQTKKLIKHGTVN